MKYYISYIDNQDVNIIYLYYQQLGLALSPLINSIQKARLIANMNTEKVVLAQKGFPKLLPAAVNELLRIIVIIFIPRFRNRYSLL